MHKNRHESYTLKESLAAWFKRGMSKNILSRKKVNSNGRKVQIKAKKWERSVEQKRNKTFYGIRREWKIK